MHEFDEEKLEKISDRIKYHMQREGITQPELAKACGCGLDVIRSHTSGKCREENMVIPVLKKMAEIFGMDEYYFCNDYLKFIDTGNVAEYLKEKRAEKHMTQKQYALLLGIPLGKYKKYECGLARLQYEYWKRLVQVEGFEKNGM